MAIKVIGKDIYVDQFDYGVNVELDICNEDGTPYDLSGHCVQLIIKAKKDELHIKEITMSGLSDNVITVPIDEDLASYPVGEYRYAVRLYKDDIFVNTVVKGILFIVKNTFESGVEL